MWWCSRLVSFEFVCPRWWLFGSSSGRRRETHGTVIVVVVVAFLFGLSILYLVILNSFVAFHRFYLLFL